MSRKPFIVGNWKMGKNPEEAKVFVEAVASRSPSLELVETSIAAPILDLSTVLATAKGSSLKVIVENCYFESVGAFTDESSPKVLSEMGTGYVAVDHPERREYFHETDGDTNKKTKTILTSGMLPIICCGETLETYEVGKAAGFVGRQVSTTLAGLSEEQVFSLATAYEPIWTIGIGKSAGQDDVQKTCKIVRDAVTTNFGQAVADRVHVQYGSSVKLKDVIAYMVCPDVDGALAGGTSLQPESFLVPFDLIKQSRNTEVI